MPEELDVDALLEAPFEKDDRKARKHQRRSRKRLKRKSSKSSSRSYSSSRSGSIGRTRVSSHSSSDGSSSTKSTDSDDELGKRRTRRGRRKRESRSRHKHSRDRRGWSRSRSRSTRYERHRSRSVSRERYSSSRRRRSHSRHSQSESGYTKRSWPKRERSLSPPSESASVGMKKSWCDEPSEKRSNSRLLEVQEELSPEERDLRTVFCMQLSHRLRTQDLEDFFHSAGTVVDVRIITDSRTHKSKGCAYVEFREPEAVSKAIELSGQKLLGIPTIIQASHAEKNRLAAASGTSALATVAMMTGASHAADAGSSADTSGPMRLYIGSLNYNITESMVKSIFEPFGRILDIQLMKEKDTGRSKGFGFITFSNQADALKALSQMNGFELAGRPMKVGHVTERSDSNDVLHALESDHGGINLGATGRQALMAKLAQGSGMPRPPQTQQVFSPDAAPPASRSGSIPTLPVATSCFMLSNMFDPKVEGMRPGFASNICHHVVSVCRTLGGCVHCFVDQPSPQGNVYVKCRDMGVAALAVLAFHGQTYTGRTLSAAYIPLENYHLLFPDAATSTSVL